MERNIKILYVDDEPLNLMLFKSIFAKKYFVFTAESGMAGLSVLQETPDVDVVISDMRMPKMSGLEFILKAKELYPHIYFYILTGYEITPEIRKYLNSGLISRYFQKPFDMKEIDGAIIERLGGK
ncbi:MAG: response regulator [Bacteroidota bacterium]|nr:response regulator [Bacteroidota bacterium]